MSPSARGRHAGHDHDDPDHEHHRRGGGPGPRPRLLPRRPRLRGARRRRAVARRPLAGGGAARVRRGHRAADPRQRVPARGPLRDGGRRRRVRGAAGRRRRAARGSAEAGLRAADVHPGRPRRQHRGPHRGRASGCQRRRPSGRRPRAPRGVPGPGPRGGRAAGGRRPGVHQPAGRPHRPGGVLRALLPHRGPGAQPGAAGGRDHRRGRRLRDVRGRAGRRRAPPQQRADHRARRAGARGQVFFGGSVG